MMTDQSKKPNIPPPTKTSMPITTDLVSKILEMSVKVIHEIVKESKEFFNKTNGKDIFEHISLGGTMSVDQWGSVFARYSQEKKDAFFELTKLYPKFAFPLTDTYLLIKTPQLKFLKDQNIDTLVNLDNDEKAFLIISNKITGKKRNKSANKNSAGKNQANDDDNVFMESDNESHVSSKRFLTKISIDEMESIIEKKVAVAIAEATLNHNKEVMDLNEKIQKLEKEQKLNWDKYKNIPEESKVLMLQSLKPTFERLDKIETQAAKLKTCSEKLIDDIALINHPQPNANIELGNQIINNNSYYQKENKKFEELESRVTKIEALNEDNKNIKEILQKDMDTLREGNVQRFKEFRRTNEDTILAITQKCDTINKIKKETTDEINSISELVHKRLAQNEQIMKSNKQVPRGNQIYKCNYCKTNEHDKANCDKIKGLPKISCLYCDLDGHSWKYCRKRLRDQAISEKNNNENINIMNINAEPNNQRGLSKLSNYINELK